jgi:hypothetical protein
MNHLAKEISAEVVELIRRYGFDLDGYSVNALVDFWMQQYPALWIRLATIEALYQGRYKTISIEQILNLWQRRTRPVYHFTGEFERMVSLRPMLSAANLAASFSSAPPEPKAVQPLDAVPEASQNGYSEPAQTEAIDRATEIAEQENADETEPGATWQPLIQAIQGSASLRVVGSDEIRRTIAIEPPPIDQFTPTLEVSDFYWRLKAVVQAMGAGTAEEIGRRN